MQPKECFDHTEAWRVKGGEMKHKERFIATLAALGVAIAIFTFNAQAADQEPAAGKTIPVSTLELGIGQYKHENYEEALVSLKKARQEQPQSSLVAYYLGLTYKQLQNYQEAIPYLKDAVTYSPKIIGALMELIDCYYQLDQNDEAKKWIAEAEKEGIRPAQVAFLKGLVLTKEGDTAPATEAFNNAKSLDKSMTQACDYQIAIAHLKAGKFAQAQDAFKEVVLVDPNSNMANFANNYINAIAERVRQLKPWKFSFGTAWQYDDNVVLKPGDDTVASNITDEGDVRYVYTAQAEYDQRFSEKLGLKNQYMFYYGKQDKLGFYNQFSHTFITQPSFYLKNELFTFPIAYNHTIVNNRSYLSSPSISAIYNFMSGNSGMGQMYLKYQNEDYRWTPINDDEDRDANDVGGGFGWYWFFARNKGFFNFRYGLNKDFAQGNNWEYLGNRWTAALLLPLLSKLNVTVTADYYLQNFDNSHTVFHEYRRDKLLTASTLIAYKFYKDSEFQLQYTFMKDNSNINVYSYDRNIYSAGFEFKF
jgi:tetratricopeptide (TPR) repeat protein